MNMRNNYKDDNYSIKAYNQAITYHAQLLNFMFNDWAYFLLEFLKRFNIIFFKMNNNLRKELQEINNRLKALMPYVAIL